MSVFAGIFSRHQSYPLQGSTRARLASLISRNPDDKVSVFEDSRCFLAKVDIGAYGDPGFYIHPSGSVSMLAGEPIVDANQMSGPRTRSEDLELLHNDWDRGDWGSLRATRGAFSAVHYHPQLGRLQLITDKLGVRPLYYYACDEYVVFASALRILEGMDEVLKRMDLCGITELTTLGFNLSDHTPYVDIHRLKSAEVVEVSEGAFEQFQYWRWDASPSTEREDESLRKTYEVFTSAVRLRLRKDTATVAFLSGGLDSRCVVAALRAQNIGVHTFTFESDGSQDRVFAARFARQAGTFHHEGAYPHGETLPLAKALNDAWKVVRHEADRAAERPQMIWSGDGGSVTLGHVYLSRPVTNLLRAGRREEAIGAFLQEFGGFVIARLFHPDIVETLVKIPRDGIRDELNAIHCSDPVRAFHIFLMLNDQRWHLSSHYEQIDVHRLEFHLPFLDSELVRSILSVPVDLCLHHRFYTKWLYLFPPMVTSVPWQSYPGHEPCPLPIPKELEYQWDSSKRHQAEKTLKPILLQEARQMLGGGNFPAILNKWQLRLTSWIYRLGLRDYGYVIKVARVYSHYWLISAGKYVVTRDDTTPSARRHLKS
jgi:hypothetical protein